MLPPRQKLHPQDAPMNPPSMGLAGSEKDDPRREVRSDDEHQQAPLQGTRRCSQGAHQCAPPHVWLFHFLVDLISVHNRWPRAGRRIMRATFFFGGAGPSALPDVNQLCADKPSCAGIRLSDNSTASSCHTSVLVGSGSPPDEHEALPQTASDRSSITGVQARGVEGVVCGSLLSAESESRR